MEREKLRNPSPMEVPVPQAQPRCMPHPPSRHIHPIYWKHHFNRIASKTATPPPIENNVCLRWKRSGPNPSWGVLIYSSTFPSVLMIESSTPMAAGCRGRPQCGYCDRSTAPGPCLPVAAGLSTARLSTHKWAFESNALSLGTGSS